MLQYPSISKQIMPVPVYSFDKLDGSNVRVEWSKKSGFSKFGSRARLLDPSDEALGGAIRVFHETLAEPLEPILRALKNERVTLFMEYFGPSSFAGNHVGGEEKKLVLFDASLYKKGFMLPKDFLKAFDEVVETPGLLEYGKVTSDLVASVKDGSLEGMTFEGIVCKSQELHRGRQVTFKVKNDVWLEKLRAFTKGDGDLFRRLA